MRCQRVGLTHPHIYFRKLEGNELRYSSYEYQFYFLSNGLETIFVYGREELLFGVVR